jgi:SPP1 family phage portal protein
MLSVAEIQRFIDNDITSEKKRMAMVGQRYYEGDHDILKCRLFYYNADGVLTEDKTRSNIKICHPFFTELSEQLQSHMLSFDENPIKAKEVAEGLQDHLDEYFDDEFWAEIGELIGGAYNKGFEYLYAYKNAENRLAFQCADSLGVVEVRENETDDGCKYIIYWYIDRIDKGKKEIRRIQVWSDKETHYYVQAGRGGKIELDKDVEVNPRPHVIFTDRKTGKKMGYGLGYIPFYRLDNGRKQFSGLKPIKALVDDYDLHACSLSNNLTDFDTPLHVVSGFQGDNLDELQQNLKTKKIVGVDAEGDVQVRTVDIPYEARKAKLDIDEKNIYRFGMGLNTIGLKDTSATTNIAIKAAYTLLEMKADKMEKQLRKVLKQIIKVVLAEINQANGTDYQISDVWFDFQRSSLTNEQENITNKKTEAEIKQLEINNVLNIAANVGDEQALKAICDIMEWDFDLLKGQLDKMNEEQNTANAKSLLGGVVTDEQAAEAGSGTIPE